MKHYGKDFIVEHTFPNQNQVKDFDDEMARRTTEAKGGETTKDILNAPGFVELMQHLGKIAHGTNGEAWHHFSLQIRSDGKTVWVDDVGLSRTLLGMGPTGPGHDVQAQV